MNMQLLITMSLSTITATLKSLFAVGQIFCCQIEDEEMNEEEQWPNTALPNPFMHFMAIYLQIIFPPTSDLLSFDITFQINSRIMFILCCMGLERPTNAL